MTDQQQDLPEEWITMSAAAERLGITKPKLSRLVAKRQLETQSDPYDERVKLVNFAELRRMFPERKR
jgi:DNA-binding MarR family transcriptional regulator